LSFSCDDIQDLVVKVYYISEKQTRESSGVILRPRNETNYFFVLTTRHSFKEKDNQTHKNVDVNSLDTSKIFLKYKNNEEFQPLKIIDTEHDLVVLIIDNSLCKKHNLKQIKILEGTYKNCGLVGYPNIAGNELECLDKCTHSISQNEIEFKINANEPLQSSHHDEVETTKGYSGSGLFTQVNGSYMLTGIISEVISYKNSFKCVNISYLLKNISLDEYGGIEIVSLETISVEKSYSLQEESNSLQLEKLQLIIHERVSKEFETLKEKYLNGIEKEIKLWIDEIKSSEEWETITPKLQAKILYEETKISIETNQLNKSEILIKEIQKLDSSLYVNRLLSWIEISKGNIDEAIKLLDNNEISTLNQKIAIYLEIKNFTDAKSILDTLKIKDKNYETYRLEAIYQLYSYSNDNWEKALKSINKSINLKDNFIEAKRVKAIILFYQSTLYDVLPDLVPPIIQRDASKIDSYNQEKINLARTILDEIEEISLESRDIIWIATIKWLTDRNKAIEYTKSLYKNEEYRQVAVQFIIVYDVDIDIKEAIKDLESEKNINALYKADTLIRYYFKQGDKKTTLNLLDKFKDIYIDENKIDNWNENYINALASFELYEEALEFIDKNDVSGKDEVKAHIYKVTNDYQSAYKLYEKLFKESKKPLYRLQICEMKSEENNWEYITEYTDYLLESFQTEKVIELVILAEINTQNFSKARELIDIWLPLVKNILRKESLLRIKAICENERGFPNRAISIWEENNLIKNDQDIFELAQLYKKTASHEKLETLVIEHKDNPNIDINTKVQIASMTKNSFFLKETLKDVDIKTLDKRLAPILLMADAHSKENIFDTISEQIIFQTLQELADDDTSDVWTMPINELIPFIEETQKHDEYNYSLYQNSNLPIHMLGSYLLDTQHTYIRSAKRFNFLRIEEIGLTSLYLDITSLLLIFSLNKLQIVIDSFKKVYLPSNIYAILEETYVSTELINIIKNNFKFQKLFYAPVIRKSEILKKDNPSNILLSLVSILETKDKEKAVVCIDDRYSNSFQNTQYGKKIVTIVDILFSFYEYKIMDKDKYFPTLNLMRKRNYLYILITSEEIIYQLKKCDIKNNNLQESEDLKILLKSLKFMIHNFKYLKPFEQTEIENNKYSEPFFVINQEREIQYSIIDLWNEEFECKEDRYIYLNWIMDNLFTLSIMTSFIQNKLSHNHDITRTMTIIEITSLFIQAITISSKNQKLYFEWLYQHFLYKFFKANPKLLSEIIANIASIMIESLLREERDENEKALTTELILNFPEEIRNKLYKNKQLMDKLAFEKKITIGSLYFENHIFIDKIKKVINGGKVEKILADGNQSIILQSTMIKHQKHIEIINNNDKRLIDDTFMILSTSKQKRKKILEANPQWFNMSNKKKNELIKEINNIHNHHDRIERLYEIQEDAKFYSNIQKDLEKRRLNFDSLIPNNIDILLNHFRLDKELSFDESFNLSVETLLNEKDISKTIDVIHHFPISFSQNIIDILKEKSEEEQRDILKSFLKTSTTPISHMQLLKVLISTQNNNFKKLVHYLTKKIFTEEFKLELKAFFAIKNFVKQEFNLRYSSLNDDIKLALIWSHSNKLMKYFNAYSMDYNWIIKEFEAHTNMLTLEILRLESQYNNDILNKSFTYEKFVLTGIDYITNSYFDYFKNTIIEKKLTNLLSIEDIYIKLTPLTHIKYNLTNSFLELDISSLPELQNTIQSLEKNLLQENYTLFTSLLTLKYGFTPLEKNLQNQLIKYIIDYQPKKETLMTLYDLLIFTKQLKNINDRKIFKLIIQYIKDISGNIKTKEEHGVLLEILVYLPMAKTDDLKRRVRLISKYIQICNILNQNDIRFMVNRFLMELPLEYSSYFLPLKFSINNETVQKEAK